jgi:hypothetical protein
MIRLMSLGLFLFIYSEASAQQWNSPGVAFTYYTPYVSGDSMIAWELHYDSLGNASMLSYKIRYIGNEVSSFHMPIEDIHIEAHGEKCKTNSLSFNSSQKGYDYFIFNLDKPHSNYIVYDTGMHLQINCTCRLGTGCGNTRLDTTATGLDVLCDGVNCCIRCGDPFVTYTSPTENNTHNRSWLGSVLVIKAKRMNFLFYP